MTPQGLHDTLTDGIVTDPGEWPDRNLAAEFVGHCSEHAGNRFSDRGPCGGVGGMGVDHTSYVWHVSVDVRVRRGIAGRTQ